MISISIQGNSFIEVVQKAQQLVDSYQKISNSTGPLPVKMVGAAGIEPASQVVATGRLPVDPKIRNPRGAGRKPLTEAEKAARKEKLLKQVAAVEAGVELNEVVIAPKPTPTPPKHVTREDLAKAVSQMVEKYNTGKVLDIYKLFGVTRLGELDEKRYHELMAVFEAALK